MDLFGVKSILGLVVIIIGFVIWLIDHQQNKIDNIEKENTEERTSIIEIGVDENKKDVSVIKEEMSNLKVQIRELLEERKQVAINYGNDLSRDEQDKIVRERFKLAVMK
ncbi:hypothetical protein JCM19274_3548 [Algibacter lectus]|uniref:Uncharacterized protein n=1 Tax=Algibacter lectus TaxID=221126 RepID=A0A090WPJ9_9FLAO|nr:hypothetical protein [Algibacter lectus]GAL78990.1 hypothetical protein JCM19274_3548 [Algibacter lectus]